MTTTSIDTAQAVIDELKEKLERAERLLLGACRIISDQQLSDTMGPDLLSYWTNQPEYADERARHVVKSLTDAELDVLDEYVERHGKLPLGE